MASCVSSPNRDMEIKFPLVFLERLREVLSRSTLT